MQPVESNGLPLDRNIFKHYGDQVEVEHAHTLGNWRTRSVFWPFATGAGMGGFAEVLAEARNNGGIQDDSRVAGNGQSTASASTPNRICPPTLGLGRP
jgi:high affinity Mn2+ porin